MSKIKNVIFDWSGVVNDNSKAVHFAVNYILGKSNKPSSTYQYFRENWSANYMAFYEKHTPGLSREEQKELYLEALEKYGPVRAYPGIIMVIKKIKKNNINLFVCSMDPKVCLDPQLIDYDLNNIFTEIICEVKTNKQDELEILIPKHQLVPEETLIIGDTSHEIECGKAVGIKTAGVTWGIYTKKRLAKHKPDYIFENPQEIWTNLVPKN